MNARLRSVAWFGALGSIACGSGSAATETVVLQLPPGPVPERAALHFEPAAAVRGVRAGRRGAIAIERLPGPLRVRIPGLCSVTVPAAKPARPIALVPWFDVGPDRAQLGFDAPFEIDVRAGCAEATRGALEWRQVEGPALAQLEVSKRGWQVRGRTLPFAALRPGPLPHGIVPFSPRTQGRYVLEARFRDAGGPTLLHKLTITSTARANGVPSIAVSQRVVLGGSGWHVREPARGGQARVIDAGDHASFTPDAPGRWVLEDGSAQALTLQAARHDTTPLDCGRAECHPSAAQAVLASPMSHALELLLPRAAADAGPIACALDCHVVGERGLHDGGFLDVAAELDWRWQAGVRWQDLPQALRRLGAVRCTSCHGPGAIPEPAARAKILKSDVCAHCHDAPPRYLHVAAWRDSRMARADALPATRDGTCARCHTTAGFLEAIGVRPRNGEPEPDGIACAACHAPHAPRHEGALLRSVSLPNALASGAREPSVAQGGTREPRSVPDSAADPAFDARVRLCASCHAPLDALPLPAAGAAALWAGRARVPDAVEPGRWQFVGGPAPHAAHGAGCTSCHGASPALAAASAVDHGFRANPAVCANCHRGDAATREAGAALELRAQALGLTQRLPEACAIASEPGAGPPPHAMSAAACPKPAQQRARYEIALVLEDPAAWVHNPAFARQLLADARAQLAE